MNVTRSDAVRALPVMALADQIVAALKRQDVLLRAEPGAGKSTGLPLALLSNANRQQRILLLEPRRLAARAVANRLAEHLGERVGQRIGLRMRSETRVSNDTILEVVTEGVLTRLLQADPSLEGVALVIFDEFHERSLQADLGFALCREVQQALREDLRLLLMSATLDIDALGSALDECRVFDCPVRQHPVDIVWLGESRLPLQQQVQAAVRRALEEQDGDVLVFLPGVAEINRCASMLESVAVEGVAIHRLHSGVSPEAQARATAAAGSKSRRIILATSLAETSITIDGVRVVIDSGLERRARLDSTTSAQRLETVSASRASATQRAGRAGRTAAGRCYRLWSESSHARRESQWQPEILRADLAPLLLELERWGAGRGAELPWLESPPRAHLDIAVQVLSRLQLHHHGQLNLHGQRAAELPLHPRLSRMLLWAYCRGHAAVACRLAAVLEESARQRSVDVESHWPRMSPAAKRRAAQLQDHVQRIAVDVVDEPSVVDTAVLLAQAFPDWVARRRESQDAHTTRYQLACGAGVVINADDALSQCEWLAVGALGGGGAELRIFSAAALDINLLQECSPEWFSQQDHVDWDERQERVVAERRLMLDRLIVSANRMPADAAVDVGRALLAGIRRKGIDVLPWEAEHREWQARVMRMQSLTLPADVNPYPSVDDESLLEHLEVWLLPFLDGVTSLKALNRIDLGVAFAAMLDYSQQTLLERWLPVRYTVPSGSQIRLSYIRPGQPVLSVRLQEMFGCVENPSVGNGQIPLTVELLSPAYRPMQLTDDLANFWTGSYREVRKEMAGRYPKHPWPDDPRQAEPTRQAKRRDSC